MIDVFEDNITFWKSSTQEKFNNAYDILSNRDFTDRELIELLIDLYYAAAEEYGE